MKRKIFKLKREKLWEKLKILILLFIYYFNY